MSESFGEVGGHPTALPHGARADLSLLHTVDERVPVESLCAGTRILHRVLRKA